jgi:hypothetical protein
MDPAADLGSPILVDEFEEPCPRAAHDAPGAHSARTRSLGPAVTHGRVRSRFGGTSSRRVNLIPALIDPPVSITRC